MSWIMLIAAAVCWAPGSRPQAEIRWYGLILGSAGVEGKRKNWDGAGRGGEVGHLPGGRQGEAVPSQASSQPGQTSLGNPRFWVPATPGMECALGWGGAVFRGGISPKALTLESFLSVGLPAAGQ